MRGAIVIVPEPELELEFELEFEFEFGLDLGPARDWASAWERVQERVRVRELEELRRTEPCCSLLLLLFPNHQLLKRLLTKEEGEGLSWTARQKRTRWPKRTVTATGNGWVPVGTVAVVVDVDVGVVEWALE